MTISTNELIAQHAADSQQAKEYAAFILANLKSTIVQTTIALDGHFGYLIRSDNKKIESALLDRVTHQSWKNYFEQIGLYGILGSKYYDTIKPYLFEKIEQNNRYYGIKKLEDFTAENILAFENQYLAIDESSLLKSIKDFLFYCGSTKNPTEYKKRLMIRSVGLHKNAVAANKAELIANLIKAIAHFKGDDNQKIIGEVKEVLYKQMKVGEEIELYAGVSLILNDNLNANINFTPEIVALLNSKLPATV